MSISAQVEQWFFDGPGKPLYFQERNIVPLDPNQPQGAIQWVVDMYNKDTDEIAPFTFYTGEGYRDVDADSINDIDLLIKLHECLLDYSGVQDFNLWIQETYPGWELWRSCKDDTERERMKNFYLWAQTNYTNAQKVMGVQAFDSFYGIDG